MIRNAYLLAIVSLLLSVSTQADEKSAPTLSAKDVATIRFVERTHLQLEHWGTSLVARLELSKGPRQSDPVLDGRYYLSIRKLRLTYARIAQSPQLAAAIRQLADTHERRLQELERALRAGVNRQKFSESTAQASLAMHQIRHRDD